MKNIGLLSVLLVFMMALSGCDKFLDEKTDKKLVVPTRLEDLQALLDNDGTMNVSDPGEGEISADDYYLPDATWAALSNEYDRRAYIWEPDFTTTHSSWNTAYRYVYNANIILEHLNQIGNADSRSQAQWNNIAGQAYFLRARGHLMVELIWAMAYDENTADVDLGIPLRLSSDFNIASSRPSNRQVYEQVINDLENAINLLPINQEHVLRASKPAALALLARTYLFMGDYEKSFSYADACLQLKNSLMDYNELDIVANFPIPQFNIEVLFHSILRSAHQPTQQSRALVDTSLYALYEDDDLRKSLFFRHNNNNTHNYKGSYNGNQSLFSGISVNEVFLIRAECYARNGNIPAAMSDLNHLLNYRYQSESFVPLEADNPQEALQIILIERRKELLFRGLRFPDVKRLNKEGVNIGFSRVLNGKEYTLPPNDLRFALSIPENVLERAPGIVQNPR